MLEVSLNADRPYKTLWTVWTRPHSSDVANPGLNGLALCSL